MSEFNRPSTLTLRGSMNAAPRQRREEQSRPAPSARAPEAGASEEGNQRIVRSDSLLQGQSHVLIAHHGETYQLRATRLGKLILTK